MKKFLSLTLCLLFLLSMDGCSIFNDTEETTIPAQNDTIAQSVPDHTETTPNIPYTEPLIAVAVPQSKEEFSAEDGTCIFTYTNQDMVLTMDDAAVADIITADFLSRNDFSSAAQDVLDAAKAAYSGQDDWSAYFYELFYSPIRLDQQVLSLLGSEIVYNGTPRSVNTSVSVTYDLITGKALTLQDVLKSNYSAENLIKLILEAVKQYSEQGILFTDYEYIISDLFSTNTPMDRWYLSDKGLCFYFTPYEIAPNTAGTVTAEIPYSALTDLLKDEYFPAESDSYTGTVTVTKATDINMDNMEFTEVILDNQGQEFVIQSLGTALNVRVTVGNWGNDKLSFQPRYTVYAATAITEGQAVVVQAATEHLPALVISYNDTFNEPLVP